MMNDYEVSHKEHQNIMLKLLTEFDQYCQQNNLRYYMTGGTLLGAVRHKGFIPWDDDVDVVMPRPDYNRLLSVGTIADGVEVVSNINNRGYYHPFTHINIVDSDTILMESYVKHQTKKGVFIDVFPLDGLPEQEIQQKKLLRRLRLLQSVLANRINVPAGFSSIRNTCKTLLSVATFFLDENKLSTYIDKVASSYAYEGAHYVAHLVALFGKPERFITPIEDYSDYVLLDFEGHQLRAPIGYDKILERSYGDYMKLPPESERHGEHGIKIYRRQK